MNRSSTAKPAKIWDVTKWFEGILDFLRQLHTCLFNFKSSDAEKAEMQFTVPTLIKLKANGILKLSVVYPNIKHNRGFTTI